MHHEPMRGNQLAEALRKSMSTSEPTETVAASGPTTARDAASIRAQIVADARVWFGMLVTSNSPSASRLLTSQMSMASVHGMVRRLRDRGLVLVVGGSGGGVVATDKLRALAQHELSDATIVAWLTEDVPSKPPPEVSSPAPATPGKRVYDEVAQRERVASAIAHVRAWIASGDLLLTAKAIPWVEGGQRHRVLARLVDLGLVVGKPGFGHMAAPGAAARLASMPDEELSSILWRRPGYVRVGQETDQGDDTVDVPDGADLDARKAEIRAKRAEAGRLGAASRWGKDGKKETDITQLATDESAEPDQPPSTAVPSTPSDSLDIIAMRMTQMVEILMHLDARQARMERRQVRVESELGLPPIEDDKQEKKG